MDKKTDTQVPIGIDGIAFSIPRGYVSLTDLAEARGVPAAKYLNGLGTHAMAVAADVGHRLGDAEEVFEELGGHVFVHSIVAGQLERDLLRVQC